MDRLGGFKRHLSVFILIMINDKRYGKFPPLVNGYLRTFVIRCIGEEQQPSSLSTRSPIGFRPQLWLGHFNTWISFNLNHFTVTLGLSLGKFSCYKVGLHPSFNLLSFSPSSLTRFPAEIKGCSHCMMLPPLCFCCCYLSAFSPESSQLVSSNWCTFSTCLLCLL